MVDLGLIYGVGVDEAERQVEPARHHDDDLARLPLRPGISATEKDVLTGLEGVGHVEVQTYSLAPLDSRPHDRRSADELGIF